MKRHIHEFYINQRFFYCLLTHLTTNNKWCYPGYSVLKFPPPIKLTATI